MPDDDDAPLVVCPECKGLGGWLTKCPLCNNTGRVPDPDATDVLDCSGAAAEVGGERGEHE